MARHFLTCARPSFELPNFEGSKSWWAIALRQEFLGLYLHLIPKLTLPTKVQGDSLGWIGSLKIISDKSLFPMV